MADADIENKGTVTPFLSVVVPAYDEVNRIGSSLTRMMEYLDAQDYSYEILIVDDGSTDGTLDLVKRLSSDHDQVHHHHYDGNRGKGYAVRYGMLRAAGSHVLFSDADLATPIEEVEHLLEAIQKGADVAIGSRDVAGSKLEKRQSAFREFGGKVFNRLVQLMAVPGIHDTQCGFKLFTSATCQNIFSRCQVDNFSFDVELLYIARQLGYKIAEVPIRWHHVDGSKVDYYRDTIRMVKTLFRIRVTDYQIKTAENSRRPAH